MKPSSYPFNSVRARGFRGANAGRIEGVFCVKIMTYSDKLKDPRWQRRRLEVMERDGFTCKRCGSARDTLNVHHINYQKGAAPWDYALNNFVTLCEACHAWVEAEIRKARLSIITQATKTVRTKRMEATRPNKEAPVSKEAARKAFAQLKIKLGIK